jgi:DNA-binding transcriptional LysR family regulator
MSFDSRLFMGLPVLAAVLEARSFVRAGAALGMTQSGVSRAIQRLEERIGIRLFERTSQSVRLMEDGKRFCDQVLPLLNQMEEVAEGATKTSGKVQGHLRINVDPTVARLFLAPQVQNFLDAYPSVHLELQIRDSLGELVADGFDAAILFGDPEPSALIARRLLEVNIFTCASPAYLAKRGRPRAPGELRVKNHECLLFRDPSTNKPFPWEFHQAKKKLTVAVTGRLVLNDALTHLEACIAGYGVAQVMDLGIESLIKNGKLVNLFPDWCDELFPLYAYHPSRHFVPAKLKAFTDFLVNALNSKQP